MTLKGYTAPLSPDGRAGIVPPPPWHYSGDFLIAEYRTDPDAVAALPRLIVTPALTCPATPSDSISSRPEPPVTCTPMPPSWLTTPYAQP